jgi:hypothetical protein
MLMVNERRPAFRTIEGKGGPQSVAERFYVGDGVCVGFRSRSQHSLELNLGFGQAN